MVTIYAIVNRHNKKRYIGSTAQKVEARWGQHKRELRNGTHSADQLQRAWDRYGEQAFLFVVLQVVNTKERRWAEQRAIDEWIAEAGRDALYNSSDKVSAVTTQTAR